MVSLFLRVGILVGVNPKSLKRTTVPDLEIKHVLVKYYKILRKL